MVKALIAVSSYNGVFYDDGAKTGLFVVEALHPFNVFRKRGIDVVFASETGNYGIDEHSLASDFLNGQDKEDFENPDSEFSKALKNIKKASDIKADEFDIFFASAGHATLFDYPKATTLQKIAGEIYERDGVVSAVCHGPAIFDGLIDPLTKEYLIKDKKITGFTDIGEEMLGVDGIMKKQNLLSVEDVAKKCGAIYVAPPGPWDDFSIVDGRIVTGVNPASATTTAKNAADAFEAN
ncbi:plasma membrane heat shock protein [Scheffersomyces spartinae]|uniref:D-lactate dehydratase n=1 Tax=Scheffersomyces spartinae TaxID=45513 RepID=A0A9P7VBQ0_9ASCO|nr:plasma membrane heat shock protein [Scheffersomyces spartinae]KAG7194586.1 plasma membrane heat shock protein [Scheffersomyces spartinae]